MVRRALIWTLVGQILSFAATFGTTVGLARILSPREIGIYAIGLALSGVLQALSAFGVATYIVRADTLTAALLETAFTINAVVAVGLAFALLGASAVPALTHGEPMVGHVLWFLAIVPLLGIVEFRPATMLQREMDFRAISIGAVLKTCVTAIVSIGAALAGASAVSAAIGAIAGAVAGALFFSVAARRHNGFRLSVADWRTMAAFGFKTLAIGGIAVLAFRLSDLILGGILGLVALGLYNRAAALSGVAIQNVYASLARVLFVKLAHDERTGAGLRRSYQRGLDMILVVMWPLLGGFAILARPIVGNLFGSRWLAAADPFAILALGQMLGLIFAMSYELFVLRDEVGRQTRIEIGRTVLGLAAFSYGCTFGIVGAAIGRMIDPLIGAVLYVPHMRRLSRSRGSELAMVYLRNGSITLVALAPLAVVMQLNGWAPSTGRGVLAIASLAAAALWLVLLRSWRHPLYGEIAAAIAMLARRLSPARDGIAS